MFRITALAFAAATMLGATAVSAQQVRIPGGPSVDFRSDGQRDRDVQREERRGDRDYDRRRDREYTTGSTGRCREVTIRERDDSGRMVSRTREDCR